MTSIKNQYEGGSVVPFIVIGVILAIVLVGAIYGVRQRSEQVRRDQAVGSLEEEQTGEGEVNQATPAPDGGDAQEDSEPGSTATPERSQVNGAPGDAEELPATGAESILPIVMIAVLAFAGTAYCNSRRDLIRLTSSL